MFDAACHTNTMASVRARIKEEQLAKADKISQIGLFEGKGDRDMTDCKPPTTSGRV